MQIVICGSMKNKEAIYRCEEYLKALGHTVLMPEECLRDEPKTKAHFNRIVDPKTDAILVVNARSHEQNNYIGHNTIAEVGLAYFFDKKIFLLNDYYEPCRVELEAWHAIPLFHKLEDIK